MSAFKLLKEKYQSNSERPKSAESTVINTSVSLTARQYQFLLRNNLVLSWMVRDMLDGLIFDEAIEKAVSDEEEVGRGRGK